MIDGKGIIIHDTINDLPVGRNVEEAWRIIEGFQWVEKNGIILPCGSTPCFDTIRLTDEDSKEYFKGNAEKKN